MAITLAKTLQGKEYNFYIITQPLMATNVLVVELRFYESSGHYTDGFACLITKREVISNGTAVAAYINLAPVSMQAAIQAVETYLVQSVPYYSGGAVN